MKDGEEILEGTWQRLSKHDNEAFRLLICNIINRALKDIEGNCPTSHNDTMEGHRNAVDAGRFINSQYCMFMCESINLNVNIIRAKAKELKEQGDKKRETLLKESDKKKKAKKRS